jgi:hypothetical protein
MNQNTAAPITATITANITSLRSIGAFPISAGSFLGSARLHRPLETKTKGGHRVDGRPARR